MKGDRVIGRDAERAWLEAAARDAVAGSGALVLLAGEAGVGKTRLVEDVAAGVDARFLRAAASPAAPPFCPVVAALRRHLHKVPGSLDGCGPLTAHLALVMPELGEPVADTNRATLFEAFRCALASVVADGPALLLLDDLQWSDDSTLELLDFLAAPLVDLPLLVIAAYRSDEVPRGHSLRRLRTNLRRDRRLRELTLEPLDAGSAMRLAELGLGEQLSPQLARTLQDRAQGNAFFVEELAAALRDSGRLVAGRRGLELADDGDVPVPETIRDAVLLRTAGLSGAARATAGVAAVAGASFDLDLVAELSGEGLGELTASGLVVEREAGRAAFRHPLARDALYEDLPWIERRALHRALADALEGRADASAAIAAHRIAARDTPQALDALLRAVDEQTTVHAHRDAARLAGQALDLWPEGEREPERIALLECYARCAELSGQLADAANALREVVSSRQAAPSGRALADAERRLAGVYALQGDRERAIVARQVAATSYAAHGLAGEAAAERLIAANFLQTSGRHSDAVEVARRAREEAAQAERTDLRALALGIEGQARAKRGEFTEGVEAIRAGLALALEHELTATAAAVYHRLGSALETAADYRGARAALTTAVGLCTTDQGALEQVCLACMAYVLRELGDWDEGAKLSEQLIAGAGPDGDTVVADGILGAIVAFRGDLKRARPLLSRSLEGASRLDVVSMHCDTSASLAWIEERLGAIDAAGGHCRSLLARWQRSEDHHYAVWALRHAASFFARHGALTDARACAEALSEIAAAAGHADAMAALAHALGEIALREGDAEAAAEQMARAVDLHAGIEIPFERAQIQLRAGVALAAAGDRELALERLGDAYRLARRLGAAPVAADAAAEVQRLGESVEQRLGRRAAAGHDGAGLSRRELQVMRLVAVGRTNREIAAELFLSPRTVDMHVRNILSKFDCRSRVEAVARAADLNLLA